MIDNWEIDQTVNNSDLYDKNIINFASLATVDFMISHVERRMKGYGRARDLEGHYHKAARYESMRESMEILYNDLVGFRGRIIDAHPND